jgi:SH3 domain protein
MFCSVDHASCKTIYVSDELIITLRQGKGDEYKIIKTMKTGTPMELLEENKGDPHAKVRLTSGEEGYVLVQYTTEETPKTIIIDRLRSELAKLKLQSAENDKKQQQLAEELQNAKKQKEGKESELSEYAAGLDRELTNTRAELEGLTAKYDALLDNSKNVVEISAERDALRESAADLSSEARKLREENSHLTRSGGIKWFLAGGGVFFCGWIIGKISRKRKQGLAL